MPSKGTTKKKTTSCLVCCGPTSRAHLGLDICRACTIFYRRNEKRNDLTCRSNSNECPTGEDLNCKKCRFDHLDRMLKQPIQCVPQQNLPSYLHNSHDSSSTLSSSNSGLLDQSLLEKLRINYQWMSRMRLIGELNARQNPPHPNIINVRDIPLYPATFNVMNIAFRILFSSSIEFASSSFPEFNHFTEKEKWNLVVNFLYQFRSFEGTYRAIELFPDDQNRFLASYTSYISPEVYDNFFSDGSTNGDIDSAIKYMKNSSTEKRDIRMGREIIARMKPRDEEILALFALQFWSIENLPFRSEIIQTSEKIRRQTLRELHSFYRNELKLQDYSSRLGQLMSFLQIFQTSNMLKEHFEILRLLDIFKDDTFIYTLQKE